MIIDDTDRERGREREEHTKKNEESKSKRAKREREREEKKLAFCDTLKKTFSFLFPLLFVFFSSSSYSNRLIIPSSTMLYKITIH